MWGDKFYPSQKTVKLFPEIWLSKIPERHIYYALRKFVEAGERDTERLIEAIKRSYLCNDEDWKVDGGHEYIPVTKEEEEMNKEVKK